MALYAVVIRKLPNHRPVTSAIIPEPADQHNVDDMLEYMTAKAQEHVRDFVFKFVEFKRAEWYLDIIELHTNNPVQSAQLKI